MSCTLLPSSAPSPNPNWGLRWFYFHILPTTTRTTATTIQNSTFLCKNSIFLSFYGLKHNVQHIKIILGAIPVQWNDFLHQLMPFTPIKLSSMFKFLIRTWLAMTAFHLYILHCFSSMEWFSSQLMKKTSNSKEKKMLPIIFKVNLKMF